MAHRLPTHAADGAHVHARRHIGRDGRAHPRAHCRSAEENSVPLLEITLPEDWQVTGAPASSAPGRGVVAVGPNGALLTVMTLRQRDLALTSYVEETATLLSQQDLIVNRGVVYDVRVRTAHRWGASSTRIGTAAAPPYSGACSIPPPTNYG
ncbi:MAG: hypothetical protein R2838_20730 [Caldilineaceae bacterium]